MYIDLDTGTILNGPIVWVSDVDGELSDSEVIEYGETHGMPVVVE